MCIENNVQRLASRERNQKLKIKTQRYISKSKISANDGHKRWGFDASVRFSLCFGRLFLFVGWFWLRENALVELVDAAKLLDGLGVIINADVTVTVVEAAVSPTLANDE